MSTAIHKDSVLRQYFFPLCFDNNDKKIFADWMFIKKRREIIFSPL